MQDKSLTHTYPLWYSSIQWYSSPPHCFWQFLIAQTMSTQRRFQTNHFPFSHTVLQAYGQLYTASHRFWLLLTWQLNVLQNQIISFKNLMSYAYSHKYWLVKASPMKGWVRSLRILTGSLKCQKHCAYHATQYHISIISFCSLSYCAILQLRQLLNLSWILLWPFLLALF